MNKMLLTTAFVTLISGFALTEEMSSSKATDNASGVSRAKSAGSAKTAGAVEMASATVGPKSAEESAAQAKAPRATPAELAAANLAAKKSEARKEVNKLTPAQQRKMLEILNEGSEKDLIAIKGIAASRSKMIVAARPLKAVDDVVELKGFGKSIFSNMVQHVIDLESKKAEPKS